MAVLVIPLSKFQEAYENNLVFEVFSITVGNEKRVYGKTVEGQANNPKRHLVVYAVVP